MRLSNLIKSLFFLLPLLEIAGFIFVGSWIGVLPTLLLIVFTTLIGLLVLRTQGFVILMQMQRKLNAGEHPSTEVFHGVLLMFAGFLLFLPGFITDIVGLFLLIPPIRSLILHWLVKVGVVLPGPKTGRTIEGEWRHEDNHKK